MPQTSHTDELKSRLALLPGRDYTLLHGHPWLFSGAFRALPADIPAGVVADVANAAGEWVARGHLNARNSLAFRLLTRDRDEAIDEAFYRGRIERAARLCRLLPADVTGYRLINAEADGLPGLIVDRYDRWLVEQFSTAGLQLALDHADLGEDEIPVRFEPARFFAAELAHSANGGGALQHVHRFAGELRDQIQLAENVLALLQ